MIDDKTTKEIKHVYMTSSSSIQDIARIYRVTVDQVLEIIGAGNLGTVSTQGDIIDASEAGPGAVLNYGKEFKVPFTVD